MMEKKKKWARPMLTILTKDEDNQERVLGVCKTESERHIAYVALYGECSAYPEYSPVCGPCYDFRIS